MEIFKLVKELGFETLPMVSDFFEAVRVHFAHDENWHRETIGKTDEYVNLVKQPFALGQFIPCDKDGKPMEKPDVTCLREGNQKCSCGEEQVSDCREWKREYQQAVDAVIFEGWKLHRVSDWIELKHNSSKWVYFNKDGSSEFKTIESYINSGGKLKPIIK